MRRSSSVLLASAKARSEEVLVAGTPSKPLELYSELATIQILLSKTYHSCRLVTCNFVTKWVMGVRSNDSTVRFVFKCACFLYHIHCYHGVTANNKIAPVVLPWSLSPSPQTPRCSTFNASPYHSNTAVTAVLPTSPSPCSSLVCGPVLCIGTNYCIG